jgi:hypothetical protein
MRLSLAFASILIRFHAIAVLLRNHAIDKIIKRIDNALRPMWSCIGFFDYYEHI